MSPDAALKTTEELRAIYRPASGGAVDKVIASLDRHCVEFLQKSPFMVLSTADAHGNTDGSPKGGQPGFARVLNENQIGWADSSGNNRLDSFENIVANSAVACLFMVPGLDETLRINGTAELRTDTELCSAFSFGDRPAKVVVVVTLVEAYMHCAKAYRRAGLWDPETWLDSDERPDGVEMLRDHASLADSIDDIRTWYDNDSEATLWKPGGQG